MNAGTSSGCVSASGAHAPFGPRLARRAERHTGRRHVHERPPVDRDAPSAAATGGHRRPLVGLVAPPLRVVLEIDRRLARRLRRPARRHGRSRSRSPVILTLPSISGSITAPKMMLASSCAASWMIVAASLTSASEKSGPPVMLMITPRAPLTEASSSSGLEIAPWAASVARLSPVAGAGAHDREAHPRHDRLHVGEVEVDHAGHEDQVGDALDRLAQHVVGGGRRPPAAACGDRWSRAAARSGW